MAGATHESVALYALGVLDENERRAVEAHLRECRRCRIDLGSLTAAATTLAFAVDGVQPPARLRSHILEAARRDLQGGVWESGSPR